jgi:hypothetical protein
MSELAHTGHSRRSVLKRALVLAGGAIGIGAVTQDAHAQLSLGRETTLYGRQWRLETPARKPGDALQPGDQSAIYGELLDRRNGRVIGQFHGSRLALQGYAGLEVHTFVLPGGTLVGMGTSLLDEAVFAVIGGTGRYAGAQGSYAAKQRLREYGGNGTAEFKLTLGS